MATQPRTQAANISAAQAMVGALKANPSALQHRGMTDAFINNFDMALNNAVGKNNEQERLKADLKNATAELDSHMKQVSQAMSEATKLVKLSLPQNEWVHYGVTATR
jgi:LPS O-antigen subunit length determinant protein (WzzB/FepE family)